ncbi:MAG: DNA starvation/stationary phase protection protein [Kangiellaceae bacterium]|jgi:starvation-inducible DNA-binding protein|nr:DNA starvation/stationary phase protection protein [Kangiellaceae bacterium]
MLKLLNKANNPKVQESEVKVGMAADSRKQMSIELSRCLADSYYTLMKTQNLHWNITGPLFFSVHNMTDAQYKELVDAIDEIAERIRALGMSVPASVPELDTYTTITELSVGSNPIDMVQSLINDNEHCARTFRAAAQLAEELQDLKTADLLIERIGKHEESAWMLRALINIPSQ